MSSLLFGFCKVLLPGLGKLCVLFHGIKDQREATVIAVVADIGNQSIGITWENAVSDIAASNILTAAVDAGCDFYDISPK
jgi:hypothetical protein